MSNFTGSHDPEPTFARLRESLFLAATLLVTPLRDTVTPLRAYRWRAAEFLLSVKKKTSHVREAMLVWWLASAAYVLTPAVRQRSVWAPCTTSCTRLQHPARASALGPAEQASTLTSWLEAQSLLQSETPVHPEAKDGWGLCLTTRTSVASGDRLLAIPRSHHLTKSAAAKAFGAEATEAIDETLDGDESGTLALLLLYEVSKGNSSLWAPYLDALPRSLELPLLWSESDRSGFLEVPITPPPFPIAPPPSPYTACCVSLLEKIRIGVARWSPCAGSIASRLCVSNMVTSPPPPSPPTLKAPVHPPYTPRTPHP